MVATIFVINILNICIHKFFSLKQYLFEVKTLFNECRFGMFVWW